MQFPSAPKKRQRVIEPLALFQRICVLPHSETQPQKFFSYELAPYPLALFDESGMRKGTKSDLYSIFPTSVKEARDKDDIYVVDGGLILHKLVCSIRKKFKELCAEHVRYVKHHYGDHCHIVFDGYQEVGLKYNEHARRYKKSAPDTVITEDTPLTDSQSLFLANVTNKSRFIDMLSKIFKEADIHTTVAQGDADRPIVVTAINLADADETRKVFVIGEDTDLLVLLAGLPSSSQELFFHKPGRNGVASRQSRNIAELKKNNFLPDTVLFLSLIHISEPTRPY